VIFTSHTMKLQPDRIDSLAVTAYGPGWLAINGEKYQHSLLISSAGICETLEISDFDQLGVEHFSRLANLPVELVLFGSGKQLRFPPAQWLQPLMERRIGLETMGTEAASRTFNILAGEGRSVAALLLVQPA